MNKTININLAGIFFHIDEDAYLKLQHYLEAIKRSFTNSQGRDEIIADIEARIAELFSEKLQSDRQVIGIQEVEEVIAIMGQPEDYVVDEEIFEDEPVFSKSKKTYKALYRDTENAYIGGVSSGLAHYVGIDSIWIRLAWILLTIFSTGAFILVYLAFWIFVPEAKTTAEKLAMRGEAVNINNIEKKIREGFDGMAGKMKDVDYNKYSSKAKSGASSAATAFSRLIMFILNVFVKFIGVFLLLLAGSALIGLFIGLFTVGTFGIIEAPWNAYIEAVVAGAPFWLISVLSFLFFGIPFFFLFILGLKILARNVASIGRTAKLVLLGLWFISLIGLGVIGIQQATDRAFEGEIAMVETLPASSNDTLYLRMTNNPELSSSIYRNDGFEIKQNEKGKTVMLSSQVRLIVKSTKDSLAKIQVLKIAEGKDSREARKRAEAIEYDFNFSEDELLLNSYFTTDIEQKYRNQKVQITLLIPEGAVLYADENTYSFHRNSDYWEDILENGNEARFLRIQKNSTTCLDCPINEFSDNEWDEDYNIDAEAKIDSNGIHIEVRETQNNQKSDTMSLRIENN